MSSGRPRVYVTRGCPPNGLEMLGAECDIKKWEKDSQSPREELLKNVAGVDGILCHAQDTIDKELLDAAGPQLKVIGTFSVGLDHIDLAECRRRNVAVGHTPNVLTDAVAEMTMTLLLAASRRVIEGYDAVVNGGWGRWEDGLYLSGQQLSGSTVGIVGLGRIGFAVGQRVKAFGISKLLYYDIEVKSYASEIGAEFATFDDLLKTSDFLIVNTAVTAENKELFSAEAFSKMKKSAVFVNTSRGGVVNQNDLYNALKSGQIWGAGLDVTMPEPLPRDSPLLTLNNCIITPHIASATKKTRYAMCDITARNILAGLKGQPLPCPAPF